MLLGFKKQFVEPIQVETKGLTLRTRRKIQPKIGETLYMYSGLRTKNSQHITSRFTLKAIQEVRLKISIGQKWAKDFKSSKSHYNVDVFVDNRKLKKSELFELAVLDGFSSEKEWADYWLAGRKPGNGNSSNVSLDKQTLLK